VSTRTVAPATPSNAAAIGRRGGVVNVVWRSVPRALGYRVRYGTSANTLTEIIQVGNRTGVEISGLTAGTTYMFTVEAYNGAGTSPVSAAVTAMSSLNMPFTPVRLRLASANTSTTASLVWDASLVRTLKDNFEDGSAADWNVASGTWAVVDHPDPTRHTKVYRSGGSGLAETSNGDVNWTDVAVEVQVEVESFMVNGTVSVLTRYKNVGNYYRFVFNNADQKFKLIRAINGAFTTLAQVTLTDVVNASPFAPIDVNHMRLVFEVVGATLNCYVDNKLLLTAQDSTHESGKIALGANNQVAYFDKIQIWIDNMVGTAGTSTLYRSSSPQSGYTTVASGLSSAAYIDSSLLAGQTYYYKVAAQKQGIASIGNSNILTVKT
jgi:hypothetical protein